MENPHVTDLLYVAAFICGGIAFALGPFLVACLFAPRSTRHIHGKTRDTIECGMEPIGPAWIRFGIVYYLYALIFLAFDVDILFLFPVALAYNKHFALRDFVEIVLFVAVLSLAVVYAWRKGVFEWKPRKPNLQ